jgi:hypothetical protein
MLVQNLILVVSVASMAVCDTLIQPLHQLERELNQVQNAAAYHCRVIVQGKGRQFFDISVDQANAAQAAGGTTTGSSG